MADRKIAYGSRSTLTMTLTSLANSTGGRQSSAVDNTSNKYLDYAVLVQTKGSAAGNTSTLDFFVAPLITGTTYADGCGAADAAFTVANRKNAVALGSITLNTTTAVQGQLKLSVASALGFCPDKFVVIAVNNSGAALSATAGDHVVEVIGAYETIA